MVALVTDPIDAIFNGGLAFLGHKIRGSRCMVLDNGELDI
jgi:hypothetical protein